MSERAYIKLSDLTRKIEQVIQQTFGEETFWIVAEISGHKFYPDRDRHYFDLVEKIENSSTETAKVKAKSWEQGSERIAAFQRETGEIFRDGLQVLISVKVSYHIIYGLSLTLRDIDPDFTLGNLERQRRETLRRLVDENPDHIERDGLEYNTRNKRLALNAVIQRIALIGSPKSEGYVDFVHTLTHNTYGYKFSVDNYYSAVQGVGAEQELVKALIQIYTTHAERQYDGVVIIRGGGSKTDFLVFDTYALARAVARFPIPIITGLGHHKDTSIVDLMAHTQTKTPTKAAEFIVLNNKRYEEEMLVFRQTIIIKAQQMLAHNRHDLVTANQQIISRAGGVIAAWRRALDRIGQTMVTRPSAIANNRRRDLTNTDEQLKLSSQRLVNTQRIALDHFTSVVKLMSPANILRKGFAILSQGDQVITDGARLEAGSQVTIMLEKFELEANIISRKDSHGKYDI